MIKLENVGKVYQNGREYIEVLKDINLDVKEGEFIAINGNSGSGKTTLMKILGLMENISSGSFKLMGQEISEKKGSELRRIKSENISFIYQNYNLIDDLNVFQNIELAIKYSNSSKDSKSLVEKILNDFEIIDRKSAMPSILSGGEKQRVAIARAVINEPKIILADEPTGNLDPHNTKITMDLLKDLNNSGKTIILVTHDDRLLDYADRVYQIEKGMVEIV